jgi:DNA-binding winged helix-turn-helix (wHTH) protein
MASKTLSVYDAKLGFEPRRMAILELQMSEEPQPSAVALPPSSIASWNNDSRPRNLETDLLGSENYQVALVPPEESASRFRGGAFDTAHPILLLPLTWTELIERLRAEADHAQSPPHSVVLFGTVRIDLFRVEVSRSHIPIVLTALEFKVLRFLVTNSGRAISRDELLDQVWGFENYPSTRTVDNCILRLRKKLELDPARPVHFQTIHGVGYKFVLEASRAATEQRCEVTYGHLHARVGRTSRSRMVDKQQERTCAA